MSQKVMRPLTAVESLTWQKFLGDTMAMLDVDKAAPYITDS